jgi:hypothetical protein
MSKEIQITGKIVKILDEQFISETFSKRVMVIDEGGEYPSPIPVEFINAKTALLDNLAVGQEVTVSVNLRGSEYKGRYYASITGWKFAGVAQTPPAMPQEPVEESNIPF